jgi:hypothetical protein
MKSKRLILSVVLCITASSVLLGLTNQGQESPSNQKKQLTTEADNEKGPIADYLAPEPGDPYQREKRKIRGKKYDELGVPIDPQGDGLVATINSHWDMNLPSLPAKQSNLIVIGKVSDAQAFLSPSKSSVYSEFAVNIEKVFKNDGAKSLVSSELITVERLGGRVRIPGGGLQRYVVAGQKLPLDGRRYVFFLARNAQENDYFHILTAYELRQGKVFPLDNVRQFKAYNGHDEEGFLNEVQKIVVSSSNPQ